MLTETFCLKSTCSYLVILISMEISERILAVIHTSEKLACKNLVTSFVLFPATRQVKTRSCKKFSTRQGRVVSSLVRSFSRKPFIGFH